MCLGSCPSRQKAREFAGELPPRFSFVFISMPASTSGTNFCTQLIMPGEAQYAVRWDCGWRTPFAAGDRDDVGNVAQAAGPVRLRGNGLGGNCVHGDIHSRHPMELPHEVVRLARHAQSCSVHARVDIAHSGGEGECGFRVRGVGLLHGSFGVHAAWLKACGAV